MKHDGRKRDVAAESYAVLVADLFCGLEVDVFVDRNGVAAGLAHDFDVSRGIAAHEERGVSALFTNVVEELCERLGAELFKVLGGDLRNQRVNNSDNIHTGVDEVFRHLARGLVAVVEQVMDKLVVQKHVEENVCAAQMRCQRERTGDQAVQSGGIADFFLDTAHGFAHERDASVVRAGERAFAGDNGSISHFGSQRMGCNAGRAVIRPHQVAAKDFRFDLKIENAALAVRLEHAVDLEKAFRQLIGALEHLRRGIAFQTGGISAGKRDPCGARRRLTLKRCQQ